MSKKILVNPDSTSIEVFEVTGTSDSGTNKTAIDVFQIGGTAIDPLAKYVEATYTNSDQTITYRYYESSSKVTLYNTITVNYSVAQDTEFTSAEWA